jgi:hypothetical protein
MKLYHYGAPSLGAGSWSPRATNSETRRRLLEERRRDFRNPERGIFMSTVTPPAKSTIELDAELDELEATVAALGAIEAATLRLKRLAASANWKREPHRRAWKTIRDKAAALEVYAGQYNNAELVGHVVAIKKKAEGALAQITATKKKPRPDGQGSSQAI